MDFSEFNFLFQEEKYNFYPSIYTIYVIYIETLALETPEIYANKVIMSRIKY